MPIPQQTRRRRSGCGCGCLSTLFTLVIAAIIIGAVALGIYASSNPVGAATLIADPGKAVTSLLAQLNLRGLLTGPQFTSYSAPQSTARNGTQVTVHWATNGADVRLEMVNRAGGVIQTTGLASSSSYSITVQGTPGDVLSYRLVATLNGQSTNRLFTITISR